MCHNCVCVCWGGGVAVVWHHGSTAPEDTGEPMRPVALLHQHSESAAKAAVPRKPALKQVAAHASYLEECGREGGGAGASEMGNIYRWG